MVTHFVDANPWTEQLTLGMIILKTRTRFRQFQGPLREILWKIQRRIQGIRETLSALAVVHLVLNVYVTVCVQTPLM